MALDLSSYLTEVRTKYGRPLSIILDSVQSAVNQLGIVAGIDPTGHIAAPDPPQSINVSAGSDHIHVTLTDNSQRSRALNYFVEWANEPNFLQPNVEHLGASRGRIFALPANDANSNPISYYFRAYSMQLGAKKASAPIYYGTNLNPTAVTLSGSSTLAILPSTGAGTASTSGQVSGQGFGTPQYAKAAA